MPPDASLRELEFLSDPDAIERRPLGGVTRGVLFGLSAMLLTALIWASVAELDEIVFARGRLISAQPNLLVQPLETSTVESIKVRVGEVVKQGQLLATLDPTFTGADEAAIRGQVAALEAKERRLQQELGQAKRVEGKEGNRKASESELAVRSTEVLQSAVRDAKEANYRAKIKAQDENIARLEASLSSNRQDQTMLASRLKILQEMEQMQQNLLERQFGARQQWLEARNRRQEVERDLELARNREPEIRREIAALKAEQQAFQSEWRQRGMEELADIRRERDVAAEQLLKAERRKALVNLVAPADAIVLEIAPRPAGSMVREAETLFTLVPLKVPMEVELQIAAADVGFVKRGDSVRIKLDAFPFQKYGTLKGNVDVVSEDAFSRESQPLDESKRVAGHFYLSRVRLTSTSLEKNPDGAILRPGSTLSGEVKVGRRSVLSYFLYPIIGTLDQSLRERR